MLTDICLLLTEQEEGRYADTRKQLTESKEQRDDKNMSETASYENIMAWRKAHDLDLEIYSITYLAPDLVVFSPEGEKAAEGNEGRISVSE